MECGVEGCTHDHTLLYLHSRCHPESPTWAYINQEKGTLTVECSTCRKEVGTFNINLDKSKAN